MSVNTNQVIVVTDSIACIPRDMVEQLNISIVPITIYFGGRTYRDWIDITPDEAYEMFLKNPDEFKTSPASTGNYFEAYREASKHASSILCITLSSKLSTGFNMACLASEQAKKDLPDINIEVLDSENVTASEGFVALAAARAAAQGEDLIHVIQAAEEVKSKATFLVAIDTIKHVYRTGRIPKAASQMGDALGIRPILTMSSGVVRFVGAVRNHDHGLNRIVQMLKTKVNNDPIHVAVMHAYARQEAEKLRERIASEFNCVELWITEFSPVIGYACGTGTIGFAFYKE